MGQTMAGFHKKDAVCPGKINARLLVITPFQGTGYVGLVQQCAGSYQRRPGRRLAVVRLPGRHPTDFPCNALQDLGRKSGICYSCNNFIFIHLNADFLGRKTQGKKGSGH